MQYILLKVLDVRVRPYMKCAKTIILIMKNIFTVLVLLFSFVPSNPVLAEESQEEKVELQCFAECQAHGGTAEAPTDLRWATVNNCPENSHCVIDVEENTECYQLLTDIEGDCLADANVSESTCVATCEEHSNIEGEIIHTWHIEENCSEGTVCGLDIGIHDQCFANTEHITSVCVPVTEEL